MDKYRLILNYTENYSNLTFCITGVFCSVIYKLFEPINIKCID